MKQKIIAIGLALIAISYLFSGYLLPGYLRDSKQNQSFVPDASMSFSDYLATTKEKVDAIKHNHGGYISKNYGDKSYLVYVDTSDPNYTNATIPEVVKERNSPFEFTPQCGKHDDGKYQKGVLLIHGFNSSPSKLRAIGKHLASKCILARSVLLPGFGTIPGDTLSATKEQWQDTVEFGIQSLKNDVKEIYLLGYSLGGALAINATMESPNRSHIAGLILFSPATFLDSSAKAASKVSYIGKLYKPLGWYSKSSEMYPFGYVSASFNAIGQSYEVIKKTNVNFKLTTLPVFIVISDDDATINSQATTELFQSLPNPNKRLLIYYRNTKKFANLNYHPDKTKGNITYINSSLVGQRILSYGHASALNPENEIVYGKDGMVRACNHYQEQSKKQDLCLSRNYNYYGSLTDEEKQDSRIIEKLMFNPKFQGMVDRLDEFLGTK